MIRYCALVLLSIVLVACTNQPQLASSTPLPATLMPSPAPRTPLMPTYLPTATALPTTIPTSVPTFTAVPTIMATATFTPLPPSDDAEREAQMAVLINALRAEQSLAPYVIDTGLSDAARAHSCDMATNRFIGHVGSDGRSVQERMPPVDPAWQWPSESIAAGSADPAVMIALWMDEPPDGWHRRNLLDPDQQAMGIGYCFRDDDPTGNRSYWTLDLARH